MINAKKDRKSYMKVIVGIILAAVAIAIILILSNGMRNNLKNSYKAESIENRDIVNYYSFSGVVESKNRENVTTKEMMQVTDILVMEGDKVSKGDVLLKNSNNVEIKAGIDGEISKIYINENDQILGGAKLMEIVDYDNLQVGIKIDEYNISSIELDEEADIYLDSIEKSIKGLVTKISREATNVNGVSYFTANIDLKNDVGVRVGMNSEVKILNEKAENVPAISIEALQFDEENEPYVFIKGENDKLTERKIEIGINDGVFVEIISGISEEDEVMIPKKISSTGNGFTPPTRGSDI